MKRLALKLLIMLVATGLLPWVAFFVGQVDSRIAVYAHVVGMIAVVLMKVWDLFKERRAKKSSDLDDKPDKEVNEPGSEKPSET